MNLVLTIMISVLDFIKIYKFLLYVLLITVLILAYVCRRATPVKSAVFWLHMFGITTEITGITHF